MRMTDKADFVPVLKLTDDGSHTLFVPGLNEHYHSVYGAVAESRHVYIQSGFDFTRMNKDSLSILEIGFGTGLNAFLTWLGARQHELQVEYTTIEKYPLHAEIYRNLNYAEILALPGESENFIRLHESPWNEKVKLSERFSLIKMNVSLQDYKPDNEEFDLVYFDAFGPDVQPEMWTLQVFRKMASGMKRGGVLVTYSTKGTVKRNLKEAGFSIEKLPGPAGKREILRASLRF
jgi:tRNA U34 5-methylaminomethyl-2-thiouridine-forming methyltransferase MnmC